MEPHQAVICNFILKQQSYKEGWFWPEYISVLKRVYIIDLAYIWRTKLTVSDGIYMDDMDVQWMDGSYACNTILGICNFMKQ